MKSPFLSADERRVGEKNFANLAFFNGLGYGFIADTTVVLLAIHFGASNFQLGFLNSLIQFSGVILLFTPRALAGKNLVRIYFWAWLLRGLVCLIDAITLVVTDQVALAIVLTSYTLFCLFRILAISVHNPIIQMISTRQNIGQTITRNSARFNLGNIVGKAASVSIVSLPFFGGLLGLLFLQGIGIVFNSIASLFLLKVPCRENAEDPKGRGIFKVLWTHRKDRHRMAVLLLNWNFVATGVIVGFMVPVLSHTLSMGQSLVYLFTLVTALAAVVSMYAYRPFVDRVPAPAALAGTFLLDAAFSVAWAFVSPAIPLVLVFLLGFVWMFIRGVNQTILGRLLIASIPSRDKVTYNSMINFWAGILALVAGMVAGMIADAVGGDYGPVFLLSAAISVAGVLLTFFLNDRRTALRQTADIFLSFRNVKTLVDLHHWDSANEPRKRETILVNLKYNATPYGLREIRRILKNPLSSETEVVLKSLFTKPRPQLLPEILEIAEDAGAYHRETALFALGAYHGRHVEDCLGIGLADASSRIRSTCAKSLGRVGAKTYLTAITNLVDDPDNTPWDLLNYSIALLLLDPKGPYSGRFFELASRSPYVSGKQSLLSLFARYRGCPLQLELLYQAENLSQGEGWSLFLDEARQLQVFHESTEFLRTVVETTDAKALGGWIQNALAGADPQSYLVQSVVREAQGWGEQTPWEPTTALALAYFTLSVLLDQDRHG